MELEFKKKMEADSWVMRGRATQTSPLWFMAWSVWHIISTQTHIQSDYLDTASTLTNKHSSLRHNHPWFSEIHETHQGNTESPCDRNTKTHSHTPWCQVALSLALSDSLCQLMTSKAFITWLTKKRPVFMTDARAHTRAHTQQDVKC